MTHDHPDSYACPRCMVGRCHLETTTYVQLYQDQLLSVPDMPVYICDVCHYEEFAIDAVEELQEAFELDEPFDTIYTQSHPSDVSPPKTP